MQQVIIITTQIIMFALLGLVGFGAAKIGYLNEDSGAVLARVAVKLTLPVLILTTMISYDFSREIIKNGLWIYFYGLVFLVLSYIIGSIVSKKTNLNENQGAIYRLQSVFGNIVFLGFPLLKSMFGDEGLVYAVFFYLASDTLLWTLGIYLFTKDSKRDWKSSLKNLVNPSTIAFSIGIGAIMIDFQGMVKSYPLIKAGYRFFYNTFNPLGQTTIYLSMLFIGIILSQVNMRGEGGISKKYPLVLLSVFKLLVLPLIAAAFFTLAARGTSPIIKTIVTLQLAMPCGSIVVALASNYGGDEKYATETVFVTTLAALITLPLMVYILKVLSFF